MGENMKLAFVTPTRGDRQEFLTLCKKFVSRQSILANQNISSKHIIIDYDPISEEVDLNDRYHKGLELALDFGADLIFFIEDDDWYHPAYVASLIELWQTKNKPSLFGFNSTIYYHITKRKVWYLDHPDHSSMFNSVIDKKLASEIVQNKLFTRTPNIYLDIVLWKMEVQKNSFEKPKNLCLGIKHGNGIVAGMGHKGEFWKYEDDDKFEILESIIGNEVDHYEFLKGTT